MKKWEKALQRKIAKKYNSTYREMEKAFEKNSKKLAAQDAVMLSKLKGGKISQDAYNEWRMKLENKLSKQVDGLAGQLGKADAVAVNESNGVIATAYADGTNTELYEIEKIYRIQTSFKVVNEDAVSAATRGKFMRAIDKAKNTAYNKRRIRSAITSGILRGNSVKEVAKALLPVVKGNKKSALRNAHEWLGGAYNCGTYEESARLDASGVKMKKIWRAANDNRVRQTHRDIDGEERDINDTFSNGGEYPLDPQLPAKEYYGCRCTFLTFPDGYAPVLKEHDYSDIDSDNYMDYEEWLENHE